MTFVPSVVVATEACPCCRTSLEIGADARRESIALEAASCTFELPTPNGGQPDFGAVNITVTSGGDTEAISRDTTHTNGWDYLPGNDKFRLYGDACEMMKADAGAQVEVVVGCTTI